MRLNYTDFRGEYHFQYTTFLEYVGEGWNWGYEGGITSFDGVGYGDGLLEGYGADNGSKYYDDEDGETCLLPL